jgi:DNA gyrase subunit A
MVLKQGQVKKTSLEKYSKPRIKFAAITIEGDELLEAKLTNMVPNNTSCEVRC